MSSKRKRCSVHGPPQAAATTVHRFVVGSSVEQNVRAICAARSAAMDADASSSVHRAEAPLTVRCEGFSCSQVFTTDATQNAYAGSV